MTKDEFFENEALVGLLTPKAGYLQFIGVSESRKAIDQFLFILGTKVKNSYSWKDNVLISKYSLPLIDEFSFESAKSDYDFLIEG